MKNEMALFALHTLMRFKILHEMMAFLYNSVFYNLFAHAKVS